MQNTQKNGHLFHLESGLTITWPIFIAKTLPSFVPEQAIIRFSSEVGQYSAVVVVTVGNADQHFERSRHLPGSELRSGEDRLAFG